ncbi:MAG TPA: hypothetical protein VG269_04065 [Tepidisphaeraceae bacterium]|jgi:hypothetical protein|nr:hypothetical protein [Tepidisphaeraceae bacterium]
MCRIRYLFSLLALVALSAMNGCGVSPFARSEDDQKMFGPATVRLHPAFTQVKEWTGGKKPDGIEAVLELQDQFGEPTRAAGTVRFELYSYMPDDPERKGRRLAIWSARLDGREEQIARWNPAIRAYSFQLGYDQIRVDRAYVLTAQFDLKSGRMFDQLIIEPSTKEGYRGDRRIQRAPDNGPGHGV